MALRRAHSPLITRAPGQVLLDVHESPIMSCWGSLAKEPLGMVQTVTILLSATLIR